MMFAVLVVAALAGHVPGEAPPVSHDIAPVVGGALIGGVVGAALAPVGGFAMEHAVYATCAPAHGPAGTGCGEVSSSWLFFGFFPGIPLGFAAGALAGAFVGVATDMARTQ